MPSYPCNPGALTWQSPFGGHTFRPQGRLRLVDDSGALAGLGKAKWTSSDTLAARLIVGFNVGDVPTYNIDDLIPLVKSVRLQQTGVPDASFILQKGIYSHHDGRGIVQEDSAQVLIIDMAGLGEQAFEDQMVRLAEVIADRFQQETVIVEIQKNGITQRVHGVEA